MTWHHDGISGQFTESEFSEIERKALEGAVIDKKLSSNWNVGATREYFLHIEGIGDFSIVSQE